ncbi:hypothetical protein NXY31_23550 [Bacteroides salyersiae]|nr:hypothetical protein [Bacteroides salyersiae]
MDEDSEIQQVEAAKPFVQFKALPLMLNDSISKTKVNMNFTEVFIVCLIIEN